MRMTSMSILAATLLTLWGAIDSSGAKSLELAQGLIDRPTHIPPEVQRGLEKRDLRIGEVVRERNEARTCDANARLRCAPGFTCVSVREGGTNLAYTCEGNGQPECAAGFNLNRTSGGYTCTMPL